MEFRDSGRRFDIRDNDLITLEVFPEDLKIMDIETKSRFQVINPIEDYYTPDGNYYWKAVRFQIADSLLFIANAPEFMIYDLNSKKFIASIIGVEGIQESIEFFDHKYDNKIYFCSSSENNNGKLFFKIFSIDLSTFIIKEVFQIESRNGYIIIHSIGFNLDNDGFIHLTTVNHSRTKELLPSLYDYYCIEAKTGEIKLKKENMTTLDKILLSSPSVN